MSREPSVMELLYSFESEKIATVNEWWRQHRDELVSAIVRECCVDVSRQLLDSPVLLASLLELAPDNALIGELARRGRWLLEQPDTDTSTETTP